MDLYPTDMTNILIRRVKRQSGVVGSCVDCIGEQLKKKNKGKKERRENLSFVVREKEKVKSMCNDNTVCFSIVPLRTQNTTALFSLLCPFSLFSGPTLLSI